MNIGSIVFVGIDDSLFKTSLMNRGYTVMQVSGVSGIMNINEPFDLMLVCGELVADIDNRSLEQLYFANNSTPVALLLKDHRAITRQQLETVSAGFIDVLYDFEISAGTIYPRIDALVINARLNRNMRRQQQDFENREDLEKEIMLREKILIHERVVNTNIVGSITSGIIICDLKGTIILTNKHAQGVYSSAKADIIGLQYDESLVPEASSLVDTALKSIFSTSRRTLTKKIRTGDFFFAVYCYSMLDYQNAPNGILMLINDITEQENINVLLYRSEKLATVGTMMSGIAHELRNPLSIISARTQRALTKTGHDPEWLDKCFKSIEAQTKRCASIVNNLLNFTRNTATTSGYNAVYEILDETLTYVEYQNIFDNITVQKRYEKELLVYGDRSRFVQVFLNLITNAADAMSGKGLLTIVTRQASSSSTLIEINDNGPGIDDTIKDKVFDPFFTTKEPGKGTGLGLAIVYKIVLESNGKIWFTSKPGSTSFFIQLPSKKERSHDGATVNRG